MKKFSLKLLPLFFAVFLASCQSGDLAMIGVDEKGHPSQVMIPGSAYSERVGNALEAVQTEVLPVLERNEARTEPKTENKWSVKTILIGFGVYGEIGIGPFKIGALPRGRMLFSNDAQPIVP